MVYVCFASLIDTLFVADARMDKDETTTPDSPRGGPVAFNSDSAVSTSISLVHFANLVNIL